MRCPTCGHPESKVVDSRPYEEFNSIRRRRECLQCGCRFTTYERCGETPIVVVKADGSSELFDTEKLFRGISIACAKLPVSTDQINSIISDIESNVRNNHNSQIRSKELGDMVLDHLKRVDDVAYIRFASVYKEFKNISEFEIFLSSID